MRDKITRIFVPVFIVGVALLLRAALAGPPEASPWQPDIETARRIASQTNRLVLIHFWGPNCGPCRQMESEVFSQPDLMKAISVNYVPVKLDTAAFPITAQQYGITSIPTDVVTTPTGQVVQKRSGGLAAKEYVATLDLIASKSRAAIGAIAQANKPGVVGPPVVSMPATPTSPYSTAAAPNTSWVSTPVAYPPPPNPNEYRANPVTTPVAMIAPSAGAPAGAVAPSGTAASAGTPPWASQISASTPGAPWTAAAPASPNAAPNAVASTPAAPWAANIPSNPSAPQPGAASMPVAPATATFSAPPVPAATQTQPPFQSPASNPLGIPPAATLRPVAPAGVNPPAANPQTSSGNPSLGLEGYDSVRLVERRQWTAGDRKWGAIHLGRTYLFTGPEEQQKFLANPNAYAPALSGDDPVIKFDQAQTVIGQRQFGTFYNNRIYLFSGAESLARFKENAERYAVEVRQAELQAGGNIRR